MPRFFARGEEPTCGSPQDFVKQIREDCENLGKLVKMAGIKQE